MKSNRPLPQNLRQPLKVSRFVQLYLLKRQSPFKFHFLDMLNNEFLTEIVQVIEIKIIGLKLKCSCLPGYYDHCIHTFYVLQKIFKIKQNDPLLWKQQYSIKDLQQLIESEKNHNQKAKKEIKNQSILFSLKQTNQQFQAKLNQELNKFDLKDKNLETQDLEQKKKEDLDQKCKKSSFVSSFQSKQQEQSVQQIISLPNKQIIFQKKNQHKIYHQLLEQVVQELKKQQHQLFGQQELKFCPICHQDITYQTPVFQCKQICKNYYHIKCLKFWVKHQRKNKIQNDNYDQTNFEHRSNIRVTCPMCRNNFPERIDELLIQSEKTFKKFYQSYNLQCNQCNEEIFIKLYHCLLCKNINLCDACYKGWKHQKHDRFLVKNNKNAKWTVPPGRNSFNMSKLEFSLEYIKKLSKNQKEIKNQGDVKQLFGQNYSKYVESNLPKPDLIQYLKQTFVNIQKQIHKTYKPVDYNQQSLKCLACKKNSIIGMKRMFCAQKHFIDQKCLTFFLKNNFFNCPVDKTYILQGLEGIQLNLKEISKKSVKK